MVRRGRTAATVLPRFFADGYKADGEFESLDQRPDDRSWHRPKGLVMHPPTESCTSQFALRIDAAHAARMSFNADRHEGFRADLLTFQRHES